MHIYTHKAKLMIKEKGATNSHVPLFLNKDTLCGLSKIHPDKIPDRGRAARAIQTLGQLRTGYAHRPETAGNGPD